MIFIKCASFLLFTLGQVFLLSKPICLVCLYYTLNLQVLSIGEMKKIKKILWAVWQKEKSLLFGYLCYILQYLSMVISCRQFFLSDSTSRVRYSSGYTCQYERGRQPKGSGTSLSLAHARLVHSAKAPLDLTAPLPVPQVFSLLLPLSLPIPTPRRSVSGTRITTCTLYILSIQGRLTLHVRRLVHISQVSGVFLKSQCQSSCTDILTKILMSCRYEK